MSNPIKSFREKLGLTQSYIASEVGVTQACVAQWERGEALPRSDKLPKLAEVLCCRIDDLFERSEA